MYKVYRCVEGVHSQNIGGEWATLREAYEHAQQAANKTTTQRVRFRILGPHPRPMPRPRGEPAPTIWYFLDDDNPLPSDAMRASAALATLEESHVGNVLRVNLDAATDANRRWGVARIKRVYYRVDQVVNGVYETVHDSFLTEQEAQDFVARSKRSKRYPRVDFAIIATSTPPQPGRRKRRRQRHDWEIEDRKTDASLVARSEEELGLGIPAQWGKGRRSRKGEYIP